MLLNKSNLLALNQILRADQIKFNELMKNHTTFKVGGAADIFVTPHSTQQLVDIINACKDTDTPYIVVGKGSNLLVRDNGIRGVVISCLALRDCRMLNNTAIQADAGVLLCDIANLALENRLTGFEFAFGIPGSFGGAIYMNAGAYGSEIKDVFVSAEVLTVEGEVKTVGLHEMRFGYRKSFAQENQMIVLSGTIELVAGEFDEIKSRMLELNKSRAEKQPLNMPSAGSTFKRPPNHFAAQLIMDSGLRGFSIGGAQVSEKHCGFIVNKGGATAEDIIKLIEHIKYTVKQHCGVELEPEVRLIGE